MHLDLYPFISHVLSPGLDSETLDLDSVAEEMLGEKKNDLSWEEMKASWRDKEDLGAFADYALKDSELAYRLGKEIGPQILELSRITGLIPFDACRLTYGQLTENYLLREAHERDMLSRNRPSRDKRRNRRRQGAYSGGFVYTPDPGLYENIAVLDFKSLYPTVLVSHNISPDTLNLEECSDRFEVDEFDYDFCQDEQGFFPELVEELIEESMSGDIMEANLAVLSDAYDRAMALDHGHDVRMPEAEEPAETQALVSGSDTIAYGALDAGCRFISGYPMTPWTDVFTIMSQNLPRFGGISEQVEDEIAAASLALGASHAGVKAMSGSAGGGFALMSEPLGLAEMTETPVVLVEAMRAGPSTGMPTKPEQADLEHVLYTSQGDSTRVVFAPGNNRECYEQIRQAFEIAYGYNVPTILIYDQKLQGELRNVDASFFDREPDDDPGAVLTEEQIEEAAHHHSGKFKRYNLDRERSVSPRTVPGQKGGRFLATGNEHNEEGHISEDPDNRVRQVDHRVDKHEYVREDLDENGNQTHHGPEDAEYGVLTWGSQQDTVFEAVDRLNDAGHSVKALGVSDLMPYPVEEVSAWLESVDEALVVEMNATGQFRGLTQRELGRFGPKLSSLLKYNGNPFEPGEIVDGFESSIDGEDLAATNMKYVPAAGD